MSDFPVLAFVGHPNVGKTSVLATLAECDTAKINAIPGTTQINTYYSLEADRELLLQLVDTPGFEHHQNMLEWFEKNYNKYSSAPQGFIEEHSKLPEYARDCQIMKVIADGSIVLYVVNDSNPILQANKNEMRILSLTGASRMAVINSHKDSARTREKWRREMGPNFSIIREFNAHNAWYPERFELLRAIREVDDHYKARIDYSLKALETDWNNRLTTSAEAITEMLRDTLKYQLSASIKDLSTEEINKKKHDLEEKFKKYVRQQVTTTENKIRKLFKHTHWHKKLSEDPVRSGDLFAEEAIKALGMTRLQLTTASALVGAAIGGSIDLALGGGSFLAGSVLGSAGGALAGYLSTPSLFDVKMPGPLSLMLPSSDKEIQVQAVDNPNFIAVLLDWMLLYCYEAMRWSHARREHYDVENSSASFIHQLNRQDLATLAAFIAYVKKGKISLTFSEPMKDMKDFVFQLLMKISDGKLVPMSKR